MTGGVPALPVHLFCFVAPGVPDLKRQSAGPVGAIHRVAKCFLYMKQGVLCT